MHPSNRIKRATFLFVQVMEQIFIQKSNNNYLNPVKTFFDTTLAHLWLSESPAKSATRSIYIPGFRDSHVVARMAESERITVLPTRVDHHNLQYQRWDFRSHPSHRQFKNILRVGSALITAHFVPLVLKEQFHFWQPEKFGNGSLSGRGKLPVL